MSVTSRWLALILALGTSPVAANPVLRADGDQIMPSGGHMVVSKGASLHSVEWRQHDIPVCWLKPAAEDAPARAIVRQAVHETWEAAADVRLSGWRDCDERGGPAKMVRILVSDAEWPRAMVGTNALSKHAQTVYMNFHLWRRPGFSGCAGKQERCLRFSAVHEFGHVLGLIHEQDRPETPADCINGLAPGQRQHQSLSDLDLLTGYDPDSLMNYCSARGFDPQKPLTLSSEDTVAIRKLFGTAKPDTPALVPASDPLPAVSGPSRMPGLAQGGASGASTAPPTPTAPPPAGTAPAPDAADVRTKPQHPLFDPN
ncbi:hypothetical protein [Novosphingobium sp.]|uniref:hypothetical protein n=1 Tax=Novosphingobium sp. TaxID=1874826 RepID=UPI003BAAE1C6